jgi:hypothetical protein
MKCDKCHQEVGKTYWKYYATHGAKWSVCNECEERENADAIRTSASTTEADNDQTPTR